MKGTLDIKATAHETFTILYELASFPLYVPSMNNPLRCEIVQYLHKIFALFVDGNVNSIMHIYKHKLFQFN